MNASLNFFIVILVVVASLTMIVGLAWVAIHIYILVHDVRIINKKFLSRIKQGTEVKEEDISRYYQIIERQQNEQEPFVEDWGAYRYEEQESGIPVAWHAELWDRRN